MNRYDDSVAATYDTLAALYSAGAIRRVKFAHLSNVRPGERVLYLGAGTGQECVEAALAEAEVIVVEQSPAMVARLETRLKVAQLPSPRLNAAQNGKPCLSVQVLCQDAFTFTAAYKVDTVVLPFFLNTLGPQKLRAALMHIDTLVGPGGKIIIVDFKAAQASRFLRGLSRLYYLAPQLLFLLWTRNPWHELYDYRAYVTEAALPWEVEEETVTGPLGLPLFSSLSFRRH